MIGLIGFRVLEGEEGEGEEMRRGGEGERRGRGEEAGRKDWVCSEEKLRGIWVLNFEGEVVSVSNKSDELWTKTFFLFCLRPRMKRKKQKREANKGIRLPGVGSIKLQLTSQGVVRLEARSRVGRKGGESYTKENTSGGIS